MSAYLISLAVGILVGVIYSFLGVRSPAPPLVALTGLLGILIGEHFYPIVTSKFSKVNDQAVIESQTKPNKGIQYESSR